MKHTFKDGKIPVVCDLEEAKQTKIEIDKNTEKKIKELREKYIKAGNTKIASLLLMIFFLILTISSNKEWLTLIMMALTVLFGFVFVKTLYGTKNPDKSRDFKYGVEQIRNEVSYPMSVQFFMLKNKAEICKAVLTYGEANDYAHLSLYWIDENDIVQKKEVKNLKCKFKHGIVDTTVDLDNECIIRPFVESTEF